MRSERNKNMLDDVREDSSDITLTGYKYYEPEEKAIQINDVLEAESVDDKKRVIGKRSQRNANLAIKEELDPSLFVEPQVSPGKEPVVEAEEPYMDDVAPAVYELKQELDSAKSDKTEEIVEDDDDYDEDDLDDADVFYEKKKFLASQYEKAQNYLEKHSQEGYHFIGKKGKRFFFKEGEPKNYYYSYCYFKYDPEAEDWRNWEKEGWKLIAQASGRKRSDAGWYILRNIRGTADYKKEIDNDDEKFGLFKRLTNSYRSTLFMFFVIMVVCAITAYLQYQFNGFLITLIACAAIFVLSFIFFLIYCRYLWNASKAKRKLKAKLRLKEKDDFIRSQNEPDYSKTEEELNKEWETTEKK